MSPATVDVRLTLDGVRRPQGLCAGGCAAHVLAALGGSRRGRGWCPPVVAYDGAGACLVLKSYIITKLHHRRLGRRLRGARSRQLDLLARRLSR